MSTVQEDSAQPSSTAKRQATLESVVELEQPEQKKAKQTAIEEGDSVIEDNSRKAERADEEDTAAEESTNHGTKHGAAEAQKSPDQSKQSDAQSDVASVAVDERRKDSEQKMPILEKGTIYFFFKPKVDLEKIDSAVDAQRSYIIMKPLPTGAKLGKDADLRDSPTRFIELPKKQLPSPGDKFMAFVASPDSAPSDFKDRLGGAQYSTATAGERVQPAARPMGEGVYCLVSIQNATHLVYMLTLPKEPGEVQKEFGIDGNQGSFVLSTKNPQSKSGSNQLPANADFPEDVQAGFGQRSWLPTTVAHLDHENAAFLMIGEQDEKAEQLDEEIKHALSTIEDEDARRVSLKKVFAELGLSADEHEAKPLTEGTFA